MKSKTLIKLQIKNWFEDRWLDITQFFKFLGIWFYSMWIVFVSTKDRPLILDGWGHFWMAQKYADIRTKRSARNNYAGGKMHYVLPAGGDTLIVLNSLELKNAKARGFYSKNLDIKKVLEHAYYISKGTPKTKTSNK